MEQIPQWWDRFGSRLLPFRIPILLNSSMEEQSLSMILSLGRILEKHNASYLFVASVSFSHKLGIGLYRAMLPRRTPSSDPLAPSVAAIG